MAGMGVLHLEIATTMLQQQGLEIITSPPIINYRETIRQAAGPIMSRVARTGTTRYSSRSSRSTRTSSSSSATGSLNEMTDKKGIQKTLRDNGWSSDDGEVGRRRSTPRATCSPRRPRESSTCSESMDSIKRSGFEDIMQNGPLAYEICRGVKVTLTHYVPHEDPAHRTYAQLMPATRRAILGAMLTGATRRSSSPILGIEVKGPGDLIGAITGVISAKRGKLINVEQREVVTIIQGEIPAAETFDLSQVMRGATAGKADLEHQLQALAVGPDQHARCRWSLEIEEAEGPLPGAAERRQSSSTRSKPGHPQGSSAALSA